MTATQDPLDSIGMVSCAVCACDLLGERTADRLECGTLVVPEDVWLTLPPKVAKRIHERPFCAGCLNRTVKAYM